MNIAILGAGTWGIALGRMLSLTNNQVRVWSFSKQEAEQLDSTRTQKNLPGMIIPKEISFSTSFEDTLKDSELILFAVPSSAIRSTAESIKHLYKDQIIVCVSKGIEEKSSMILTDVIKDALDRPYLDSKLVALSGPTHAEEVAKDMPTSIVSACTDIKTAKIVQKVFSSPFMRVYTNTDIRGVEICGAVKNIIALASGISAGLGYGDNAKAAIITRGIAEIKRLGLALNCSENTFNGLAGIGDLIVTATSMHSRNYRCGLLIGQGYSVEEAKEKIGMVVESLNSLKAIYDLAKDYDVEMPIVNAIYSVIYEGYDLKEAVNSLFNRRLKSEIE